jgi:hypothetical protein
MGTTKRVEKWIVGAICTSGALHYVVPALLRILVPKAAAPLFRRIPRLKWRTAPQITWTSLRTFTISSFFNIQNTTSASIHYYRGPLYIFIPVQINIFPLYIC